MASLAVPTKRVSTTLRANPVPSARIGLAATAGRGSEFNKLAEELNSHPAERLRSCQASSDSTRPDLSGKATNQELGWNGDYMLGVSIGFPSIETTMSMARLSLSFSHLKAQQGLFSSSGMFSPPYRMKCASNSQYEELSECCF